MINTMQHIQDNEEELKETLKEKVVIFCDRLDRNGIMKIILEKAKTVVESLPKELGRGGKAGAKIYEKIEDTDTKQCLDARIQAAEDLSTIIDDLVEMRYVIHVTPRHNLTDSFF
jgi:hypothetical protein